MPAPQPTSRPTPAPIASGPSPAVMGTYARQDIVFERGEGAWLITVGGERYLDFGSGVAVNSLGHAHPRLVAALTAQAQKLWHTSNLYRVAGQERLAERLVARSFAGKVFFCNSGAEACEGAIKAARRFHHVAGANQRNRIITFDGAFHGRTLTTIAAAGNAKYLEGFAPAAPGFDHVRFGDLAAVEAAIGPETAAIMIEPIQGEGGVRVAPAGFLAGLRTLCDRHGLLLVLDEVQTGIGRTGRLFAHEHSGIRPDIMAIAKGLGGGFPVGAFLTTAAVGEAMTAGSHGSTFGGNPLAMSVGNAVLDVIEEPGFLESVEAKSRLLAAALNRLAADHADTIEAVRGQGLLLGLKFRASIPAAEVVKAAIGERLLTVGAAENVVRILPPLIVSADEIDEATSRLARALAKLSKLKA